MRSVSGGLLGMLRRRRFGRRPPRSSGNPLAKLGVGGARLRSLGGRVRLVRSVSNAMG